MKQTDVRQLYGPNRFTNSQAIQLIFDFSEGEDITAAEKQLQALLEEACRKLGWPTPNLVFLQKPKRLYVAFDAPYLDSYWELGDALGSALIDKVFSLDEALDDIRRTYLRETTEHPLYEIICEANKRDIPVVYERDDEIFLGQGTKGLRLASKTTPVPWDKLGRIPILTVTGTNGKTTCTRLLARLYRELGYSTGNTSSDGVQLNGEWLIEGDCTGPDSMRDVLFHPKVEVAVLEAARGGILRRGLPFDRCDLALVTNITPDHLGLGNVDTLDEMAHVKATTVRALGPDGVAVLSADDPRVEKMERTDRTTVFFSRRKEALSGRRGVFISDTALEAVGFVEPLVIPLTEIPITLGGAAQHNAENAAAVVAAALALSLPYEAIRRTLQGFQPTYEENPGRSNVFSYRGATVILDFAHNVDGIRTLAETAKRFPAKRRILLIGQAGDRSDELLRLEAASAWEARPDLIVIKETPEQLRGRPPKEVPEVFRGAFLALGAKEEQICLEWTELDGVKRALQEAGPGDLVLLMVHLVRAETLALLRAEGR